MKASLAALLAGLLTATAALPDEAKPAAKKSEKKAKPAAKSDKNAAQKAEASVGKFLNDNKIWVTHPDKSGKK
ncbi:MAG: hypothetical protein JO292_00365 [Betaproteobacteria bacterium]|nr:hypothetical protein [Betaproteobacteria bacterium]MBV9359815.1 hypothetical protein [Betaproteobacteria bacterium]